MTLVETIDRKEEFWTLRTAAYKTESVIYRQNQNKQKKWQKRHDSLAFNLDYKTLNESNLLREYQKLANIYRIIFL